MKSIILFVIGCFFSLSAFCQNSDSLKNFFYRKYGVRDTTYYGEIQRAWKAMQGLSYAVVAPVGIPLGDRRLPLRDGEGVDGYLLEANFDFRFALMMGRPNADWSILRRMRLTFDYRNNLRMTLDDSKPIVPYSNDVGLGYEFAFRDSKSGWFWQDKDPSTRIPLKDQEKLNFTTLSVQVHHYSNGQRSGFYYYNADSSQFRNDYLGGDFSTNFVKIQIAQSWGDNSNHSLINVILAYQKDFGGVDTALSFSPEQDQAYGKNRLKATIDWYSGVNTKNIKHLRQWHIRGSLEYILDKDLSNFDANIIGTDNKYRLSGDLYLEWRPLMNRTVGYMAHFYMGRDYLNIRYDDIIFMAQAGITLALDKYYPFGWREKYTGGFK